MVSRFTLALGGFQMNRLQMRNSFKPDVKFSKLQPEHLKHHFCSRWFDSMVRLHSDKANDRYNASVNKQTQSRLSEPAVKTMSTLHIYDFKRA